MIIASDATKGMHQPFQIRLQFFDYGSHSADLNDIIVSKH